MLREPPGAVEGCATAVTDAEAVEAELALRPALSLSRSLVLLLCPLLPLLPPPLPLLLLPLLPWGPGP